jgi:hypothetical protein
MLRTGIEILPIISFLLGFPPQSSVRAITCSSQFVRLVKRPFPARSAKAPEIPRIYGIFLAQ